jgi:Nif-specific regulatory protein
MATKSSELAEVEATLGEVRRDPVPLTAEAGSGGPLPASADPWPLDSLLEMGELLSGPLGLRPSLERVLEKLERDTATVRAAVMLLEEEAQEIHIEASVGFDGDARRARYRIGEGIIGRVVQSGRSTTVPAMSREPLLVHRATRRRKSGLPELSFVCVPIALNRKPVGALAVDLKFSESRDYPAAQRYFGLVAAMIAQALKVHRVIEDERRMLLDENSHPGTELQQRYHKLVGTSRPMQQAYEQIAQAARTNTTVLIRGESGTGKELIAHAIHSSSPRAGKPFVKVSVAALPDTLIESELFGCEKGAFTGAQARKGGCLEMAEGGTLFLDEIGELNLFMQLKLLRVLQEHQFERLDGTGSVKLDVRVVAATNRNLEAAMAQRQFRDDLYYRLNVFSIFVPPLRDRRTDVMLLADYFLARYARQHGKRIRRIATPAIDMLMNHHWPGNVGELENTIERAVLTCDGRVIHGHDLPPTLQTAETSGTLVRSLSDAIEQYEKDLILDALKSARGNRAKAARLLGTTERIIGYKVDKYQIDVARFRSPAGLQRAARRA